MAAEAFRCAAAAEERAEPLFGTASHVWNWMLLEQPGPWGRDALMESRMPREVASELRRRARAAGVRIVLIRRGVRLSSSRRRCYFAQTTEAVSRVAQIDLESLDQLLDLDLSVMKEGRLVTGASERKKPMFLVCTHGRHDACCSIRGNQVSRIACALPGVDAWESSHIGGDRFAANMICFPHGIYYGRVAPGDVEDLVALYERGELSMPHFRGRSCYPFVMQAAECYLRQESGLLGIGDITLLESKDLGGNLRARFALIDGRTAEIEVQVSESSDPQRLTCTAPTPQAIPTYELASCSFSPAS